MSKKLYVGNLSFQSTESSIQKAFSAFGNVQSINIITDRETGRPRGFAFVEMSSPSEAQAAIDGLNGRELDGRSLTVNVAKEREPRGGGGGYGGGGGGYGGGGGGGRGGRW
jgi:RNA recognition motif-containing protein